MSGDVLLAVGASRRVLKFATLADFAARLAVSFASAFSLVCFESSCQKFADDNKRPGVLRTQANIATEAIANRNTRDFTILLSSQKCRVGPIISHIEGGGYCSRVLFRRIPECEVQQGELGIAGTVLVAASVAASPAAAQARAIAQAGPMEVSPCKKANGFPGFQ